MEAANLTFFWNLETPKNQIIVLSLQKYIGGHESGRAWSKTEGGGCAPRPWTKTATASLHRCDVTLQSQSGPTDGRLNDGYRRLKHLHAVADKI